MVKFWTSVLEKMMATWVSDNPSCTCLVSGGEPRLTSRSLHDTRCGTSSSSTISYNLKDFVRRTRRRRTGTRKKDSSARPLRMCGSRCSRATSSSSFTDSCQSRLRLRLELRSGPATTEAYPSIAAAFSNSGVASFTLSLYRLVAHPFLSLQLRFRPYDMRKSSKIRRPFTSVLQSRARMTIFAGGSMRKPTYLRCKATGRTYSATTPPRPKSSPFPI